MKSSFSFSQIALVLSVGVIVFIAMHNLIGPLERSDVPMISTGSEKNTTIFWGEHNGGPMENITLPENTIDIGLGVDFSVALLSDGRVMSWGSNDMGQLGRPSKGDPDMTPAIIPGLSNIVAISTSYKHVLALDRDGNIFAFGSNFTGQIGDGTNDDARKPIKINAPKAKKIAAGYKFSIMIDEHDDVYVWGAFCSKETQSKALALLNSFGGNINSIQGGYYDASSRGTGSYDHSEDCLNEAIVGIKSKVPKKLEGISKAKEISVGYGHALILKTDGTVWSFGCNTYGQLGRNKSDNGLPNPIPAQIPGIKNATKISAGFRTSLILNKEGTLYYWGVNAKIDEAGNTFNLDTPLPLPLPESILHIDAISSGRDFSLIIADGKLYGFGNDTINVISPENESYIASPIIVQQFANIHPLRVVAGGTYAGLISQK